MPRRSRLEPLKHLLLGAIGLSPAVSCGGSSVGHESQAGSGGTGAAPQIGSCNGATPVGTTGWVGCDTGIVHRESIGTCPVTVADPAACGVDCSVLPRGRCFDPYGFASGMCISGCESDSDCGSGEVCFCEPAGGRCIAADCKTDADCGDGSLCATYVGPPEPTCDYYVVGVACQTLADECTGKECNCTMGNGVRECTQGLGGCGRPFLVGGVERRAAFAERSDWSARDLEPLELEGIPAPARAALAEHWTDAALMEHASIAAFARFSLELVALGAPAELVRDSARAMADETRHAELCFALASAYGGRALGPGRLTVNDCLRHPSLADVLKTLLLEGCIGETVAAAEARELAAATRDPVVRRVLETIADDEARHALLAYRFVRWALAEDRALTAAIVHETLLREIERPLEPTPARAEDDTAALELGRPTPSFRAALRHDVLRTVVGPCLQAMIGSADAVVHAA